MNSLLMNLLNLLWVVLNPSLFSQTSFHSCLTSAISKLAGVNGIKTDIWTRTSRSTKRIKIWADYFELNVALLKITSRCQPLLDLPYLSFLSLWYWTVVFFSVYTTGKSAYWLSWSSETQEWPSFFRVRCGWLVYLFVTHFWIAVRDREMLNWIIIRKLCEPKAGRGKGGERMPRRIDDVLPKKNNLVFPIP